MRRTRYKRGDWNVIEDIGGRRVKASQTRLRWDGLRVLAHDYEERHPQDFVRAVSDDQSVPWTRPEPQDVEVSQGVYVENGYWDYNYTEVT